MKHFYFLPTLFFMLFSPAFGSEAGSALTASDLGAYLSDEVPTPRTMAVKALVDQLEQDLAKADCTVAKAFAHLQEGNTLDSNMPGSERTVNAALCEAFTGYDITVEQVAFTISGGLAPVLCNALSFRARAVSTADVVDEMKTMRPWLASAHAIHTNPLLEGLVGMGPGNVHNALN